MRRCHHTVIPRRHHDRQLAPEGDQNMNHPFQSKTPAWMSGSDIGTEAWPGLWHELEPDEDGVVAQPAPRRLSDPGRLTSGLEPSRASDSYFLCHPDLCLAESRLLESPVQRGRSCLRC